MRKTILSIAVVTILGLGLAGCGAGEINETTSTDEMIDQAAKQAQAYNATQTDITQVIAAYGDNYIPLYDTQSGTAEAIKFNKSATSADLIDVTSDTVILDNLQVVVDVANNTLTIKNALGQNQDLVFDIVKKDGGEYLTKGNVTWETGKICDSVAEVKEIMPTVIEEVEEVAQEQEEETEEEYPQIAVNGMTYQIHADPDSSAMGEIIFSGKSNVSIDVNNGDIFSGKYNIQTLNNAVGGDPLDLMQIITIRNSANDPMILLLVRDIYGGKRTINVYNYSDIRTGTINEEGGEGDNLFNIIKGTSFDESTSQIFFNI